MNDLISIIVPVYNGEQYIENISSVLSGQSYSNIEIIFVNDGSTDSTYEMLKNISKFDERIKIINKLSNTGVSHSKNLAITESEGKYLLFVDVDDIISQDIVNILYSNIIKYDADISACDIEKVYDENDTFEIIKNNQIFTFNQKESIQLTLKGNKLNMFTTAKLYKRKLFDEIRFPESMRMIEDAYIACQLLLKSDKVVYTREKLYKYIFREGSLMNKDFHLKDEINIVDVQYFNQKIILDRYPDLKLLTEQRITWSYIRLYDRMVSSNNYIKSEETDIRQKLLERRKYVYDGQFFNFNRKILIFLLKLSPKLYAKIVKRNRNVLF